MFQTARKKLILNMASGLPSSFPGPLHLTAMEMWKDIEGYEGLYQISDNGSVKSLKFGKEKILKPNLVVGYNHATLFNKTKKHHLVHRIVAIAFIPNPENKRTVNHKNGIRSDNRIQNLEWATYSENHKHSYRELGRIIKRGKYHHRSMPIVQYTKSGNYIQGFSGIVEAVTVTGINYQNIYKVCNDKHKTAGGFIWEYLKIDN